MAHFDALVRRQAELTRAISRTTENFKKLATEKRTVLALEGRLANLETQWSKFQNNNDLLLDLQTDATANHPYFERDQSNVCSEAYLEQKEFLQSELQQRRGRASSDSPPTLRSSVGNSALPKISLPRFSGQYQDWAAFRNLFASMIIQNEDLPDVQRLHYLRTHVSGEASRLIANLPLTDASFPRAWEALENRYEHRRRIIDSHLDAIFQQKALAKESAADLKALTTRVVESLSALESMSAPLEHWDWILVYHVSRLLDTATHSAWETSLGGSREPAKFSDLISFLETRIRTFEVIESRATAVAEKVRAPSKPAPRQLRARVHATTTPSACAWCSADHYVARCPEYQGASPNNRQKFIKEKNLCLNCLGYHHARACRSEKTCRSCSLKHHSSIHDAVNQTSSKNDKTSSTSARPSQPTTEATTSAYHANPEERTFSSRSLLATARAYLVTKTAAPYQVRLLIDQGSELSFVREAVVQNLRIPRKRAVISLTGIGATSSASTRGVVELTLQSRTNPAFNLRLQAHVLPKLTNLIPSAHIYGSTKWPHLLDLDLADPDLNIPGQIDLIIGADYYGSLIRSGLRTGPPGTPVAQDTALGWIVSGPVGDQTTPQPTQSYSTIISEAHSLDELVERFWKMEQPKGHPHSRMTPDEEACEEHFAQTHSRDDTGRYIVRLPFRGTPAPLGNSRSAAERALQNLQRRCLRDVEYRRLYHEFLEEYLRLGHMSELQSDHTNNSTSYFLPHHGVLRDSSTTTRLRVVFNGSAKTDNSVSLNDCLFPGPKLQKDLDEIILRWRRHPVVFSADLQKMYRQIWLHKDDRPYQQILWARDHTQPAQTYQLNTVTYGLAPAPYLALRVLQQLVGDEGGRFPLAAPVIRRDMYVDDVLAGAEDPLTARLIIDQLNQLLMAGGFCAHKWTSNHPDVLLDIVPDPPSDVCFSNIDDSTIHRTLGLSWRVEDDSFVFRVSIEKPPATWSKRQVLSHIARIFDPLGWLAPFVINAKILLQRMWTVPLQWDDPLPPLILGSWQGFYQQLANLSSLTIPRWLGTRRHSITELHGFSDASQDAIAACVYARVISTAQPLACCSLIAAKTKVAPLKRLTIPRLELSAAVLLAQLMSKIRTTLDLNSAQVHAWTDSSVVLYWLQRPTHHWKDFVANRVTAIFDHLPDATWRHVPGDANPADSASRGISLDQLNSSSLWWHGPSWLEQSPASWPASHKTLPKKVDLEERRAPIVHTATPSTTWTLIYRFSRLSRLLRVTAYILRAVAAFKRKDPRPENRAILPDELRRAKHFWLSQTQKTAFQPTIHRLQSGMPLEQSCSLKQFTPFLDENGLLRVGGRLKNSFLGAEAVHPALIPGNSAFSALVIDEAHRRTLHGGVQSTLAALRQEYWIPSGRRAVKSHILRCVVCARHRAQAAQQLMGQLPRSRVTPSRPFLHSGVDYAGPFQLKTWRGRAARTYKAYLIVFVCFATSAVHLEMATDYTTDGFLAAYRRFCGRRGICTTLTSDCGSNLIGADQELKRLFKSASKEATNIAASLALVGTHWKFNPPGAPHFGGKWEAAVKSTKHHLRRTIGETVLTYEEFNTLLTQIEGILNSRPLCPLSDDPSDLSALTPAHFLIGEPITSIPEPSLLDVNTSRLSRWQLCSQITERFWRRWSSEYLQRLQGISKWHHASNLIKIGTLALIIDERLPPTKWALARVIQVHPGADGLIRVATVRTASSTYRRPISKLCPLPIEVPPASS